MEWQFKWICTQIFFAVWRWTKKNRTLLSVLQHSILLLTHSRGALIKVEKTKDRTYTYELILK